MIKLTCKLCGGTNRIKGEKKTARGKYESFDSTCFDRSENEAEQIKTLQFYLGQFIRCDKDGDFDPENWLFGCASCNENRKEVLSHIINMKNQEVYSQELVWVEKSLKRLVTCPVERRNEKCKGCECEREEILNLVYHYVEFSRPVGMYFKP